MNRKSATINSVAAHKVEPFCRPELIAPRIAAVLMPPSRGHEQQLRQRAVHFTADELEEGHNVFRLHVHKMPPPAQQDTPPAETKNHFC